MARYADTCRDMQIGDIILGLKTTCWYEITDVRPTLMAFSTRAIALGPDNCGRHRIGKQWDADRWTDSKVLYQKVANPGYRALAVGDILVGKSTGAIYRVSELDDHRMQFRAKVVAHGHGECSIRIGNYTEPRDFDHGAYTLYREYGKSPTIQTTTNTAETGTYTQEYPTVDNAHLTKAIDALAAEEATKAARPTFKRISKLVRETPIGAAITVRWKHQNHLFYGRIDENTWTLGGSTYTNEKVIANLVQDRVNRKARIERLTPEAK